MYPDPLVAGALADLSRGLHSLHVRFCLIGALVPELLLATAPSSLTLDADVTVLIESLDEFEKLKDRLGAFGFARTSPSFRLNHTNGGRVDLIPYGEALAPQGILQLEPGLKLNVAGYGLIVPNAVLGKVGPDLEVPVVPIPLYVLIKLVAFGDRRQAKDLSGVLHCLRYYVEDDDRKYGLEHGGAPVPFEMGSAYLVGTDGRGFHDKSLIAAAARVLNQFVDARSAVISLATRDDFHGLIRDDERQEVFELFQSYRSGAGI